MVNIRKLEAELWESADLLRAGSKLTSNQYCMPVLGLIFLRYAYSRFKMVETEIISSANTFKSNKRQMGSLYLGNLISARLILICYGVSSPRQRKRT